MPNADNRNEKLWEAMLSAEEHLLVWQNLAQSYHKSGTPDLIRQNGVLFHLAEARHEIYKAQKAYDDYIIESFEASPLNRKKSFWKKLFRK